MKMVSAAKFGRAERELRSARGFGEGASGTMISLSFGTHSMWLQIACSGPVYNFIIILL